MLLFESQALYKICTASQPKQWHLNTQMKEQKILSFGSKYPKVFTVRVIDPSENHEYGLPDLKSDRRPSPKAFNLSWNRSSSLTEVNWIYFILFSHG